MHYETKHKNQRFTQYDNDYLCIVPYNFNIIINNRMKRKAFLLLSIVSFIIFADTCVTAQNNSVQKQTEVSAQALAPETDNRVFYNAFSHNDYWRPRPLLDALSYRFNCVEADLWLIDGKLYVAHDRTEIEKDNTFEEMYLKPLVERIKKNGGKVYKNSDRPFFLMVDCKTSGEEMYPVLKKVLEPYKDLFCSVNDGEYKEGAILFFLSGDRPLETLPKETSRFVFLDGRIKDLDKGISHELMPVISDNYANSFSWKGNGNMPEEELKKMREIINQTHKEGKLFRWWGAPQTKTSRQLLLKEGVDLIGTDDLEQLYDVLK